MSVVSLELTLEKFGYNPNSLKPSSHKLVVSICQCGSKRVVKHYAGLAPCKQCHMTKMAKASGQKRLGTCHSEGTKSKIRAKSLGENNPNFGRKFSAEVRQKMSRSKIGLKNHFFGKSHSDITKLRLRLSKLNKPTGRVPHGICSTYIKTDGRKVRLRSSWEYKVAEFLDSRGIEWEYESVTLPITYLVGNCEKTGTYTPDFVLKDEILEVKGYWRDDAILKFEAAKAQYPQHSFKVIGKKQLIEMGLLK